MTSRLIPPAHREGGSRRAFSPQCERLVCETTARTTVWFAAHEQRGHMNELTPSAIDNAVARTAPGLAKYLWIQEHLHRSDVRQDAEFQRRFNGFYRVRRDKAWRTVYFDLMEDAKSTGIGFPDALAALGAATGRVEASFASKLVASLEPTLPVVDRFVLDNFGLSLPYQYAANRERTIVDLYAELQARYARLLASDQGRLIVSRFAEAYPNATITDLKKVDLVLWQHRA